MSKVTSGNILLMMDMKYSSANLDHLGCAFCSNLYHRILQQTDM